MSRIAIIKYSVNEDSKDLFYRDFFFFQQFKRSKKLLKSIRDNNFSSGISNFPSIDCRKFYLNPAHCLLADAFIDPGQVEIYHG